MKRIKTKIDDLWVAKTDAHEDTRGSFMRLFCEEDLNVDGAAHRVRQINHSISKHCGTIRGLHYQVPPFSEVKYVRCLRGSVFDVAVDLRADKPTYLKWHGEILSADNARMMIIPEGFAHGFQTLEDDCALLYLHTQTYQPGAEGGLHYADPQLAIDWPLAPTIISDKDQNYAYLADRTEPPL